jgi:ribosome-associated heat shock protein Hsp15
VIDGGALRLDVALHRLCLTRSRNEARTACEAGAVTIDGRPGRPRDAVAAGARIVLRSPSRLLEVELLALPGKSVSRAAARTLYHVIRDDRLRPDPELADEP